MVAVSYGEPKVLNKSKKKPTKIKNNLQTFLKFWRQSALTVRQLENKVKDEEHLSQISFWLCCGQLLNFASAAVSVSQTKSFLHRKDLPNFTKIPVAF